MSKVYRLMHEELVGLLDYDPATGIFVWKVSRSNRVAVGSRAGVVHRQSGGRYISIGGHKFMAHRLAFFHVNKRWPNTDVRPLDGNYDNCAITNLREVTRVELQHARGKIRNNTSGYVGVSPAKFGRWQAKITWNYKQLALGGSFETPEDAAAVYDEAAKRLKDALSEYDVKHIMQDLRLWKRQRVVWKNMKRTEVRHEWPSFDAFCQDVRHIPDHSHTLIAGDAARPIGPDNFQFLSQVIGKHEFSTKDGRAAYMKARREANPNHWRRSHLKSKYDIDDVEFHRLLNEQFGVCTICGKTDERNLSADHDHVTGKVRGLLCKSCNYALGQFGDDVSRLRAAVNYLEKHGVNPVWSTPSLTEITHLPIGQELLQEARLHG